ncbi:hypothetical protein [Methylomonas fluvii]|uniref:Uncharacterized protein n=1 Tax=Methylomonas fluvii TaxID=1854564 RepID=A0ABR9D7V5_9GAMM|nr:hypothetical protein [Methylomonas fluvii]MBD9359191.1 hypothetical protein [Methylomonas fluvii]
MNISTCQVYPEVDLSYKIPSFLMKELRKRLNSLNKEIIPFKDIFNGQDFELGIVISATCEKDKPLVMGPTFFNRYNRVDFVFHIPYKKLDSSYDEFSYVVENLRCGLVSIFDKYSGDSSGVNEVLRSILEMAENP